MANILTQLTNRFPTNVTIPTNASELAVEGLKQLRRLTLPRSQTGELPAQYKRRQGYVSAETVLPKTPKKGFNSFVGEVKNRGIAKQYNYMVEIMPPPCLVPNADTANLIRLFCDQIMFPEMALATVTLKDYGLNREAVYDKMYGNVTASFLCDQGMIIKDFFDAWISSAVSRKNGVFQYPNRYISYQIRIHQLNAEKKIVYTVVLNRVTLKIVNDIMLAASSKDASRFQVQFAYESWDSRAVPKDSTLDQDDITNVEYVSTRRIEDTRNTGSVIVIPTDPIITDPSKIDSIFDFGWKNDVAEFIDTVVETITEGGNIVNGIVDNLTGISNGTVNSVTGGVVGTVSNTVNGVINGVTGAITTAGG